jgi:hypothetical protein
MTATPSLADAIDAALAPLAGLPLLELAREGAVLVLHFGVAETGRPGGPGGPAGDSARTLRVSCAWRLTSGDGVLTGAGDLFTPADPDAGLEDFDWDAPGASWLDVRLAAFHQALGGERVTVERAAGDRFGGLHLALSDGIALEVFPESSDAEHVDSEFWRLGPGDAAGPGDIVVGSRGLEHEPGAQPPPA